LNTAGRDMVTWATPAARDEMVRFFMAWLGRRQEGAEPSCRQEKRV